MMRAAERSVRCSRTGDMRPVLTLNEPREALTDAFRHERVGLAASRQITPAMSSSVSGDAEVEARAKRDHPQMRTGLRRNGDSRDLRHAASRFAARRGTDRLSVPSVLGERVDSQVRGDHGSDQEVTSGARGLRRRGSQGAVFAGCAREVLLFAFGFVEVGWTGTREIHADLRLVRHEIHHIPRGKGKVRPKKDQKKVVAHGAGVLTKGTEQLVADGRPPTVCRSSSKSDPW